MLDHLPYLHIIILSLIESIRMKNHNSIKLHRPGILIELLLLLFQKRQPHTKLTSRPICILMYDFDYVILVFLFCGHNIQNRNIQLN